MARPIKESPGKTTARVNRENMKSSFLTQMKIEIVVEHIQAHNRLWALFCDSHFPGHGHFSHDSPIEERFLAGNTGFIDVCLFEKMRHVRFFALAVNFPNPVKVHHLINFEMNQSNRRAIVASSGTPNDYVK